jgi:hypothetical protein
MTNIPQKVHAPKARAIALYLPQYHPIPENDEWWGKGFTEWTNVAKARPLFPDHYQPRLPADLGYYDLRVPEVREAQAALAREHGIEGFCYWHYWFGNGRRLLERPFNEILQSGKPEFPFCLGWANETWSGIWHGCPNRILIEQTYPGIRDYEEHFAALLPAFKDSRYITVSGKKLFAVYRPQKLPDPAELVRVWNRLAANAGLRGIFFIGIAQNWNPKEHGFDAVMAPAPATQVQGIPKTKIHKASDKVATRIFSKDTASLFNGWRGRPAVTDYECYVNHSCNGNIADYEFPVVVPNWDNTPRVGSKGLVLTNSHPKLFRILLRKALEQIKSRPSEHQIIFLKSWNEWAEGNYLEPDSKFGLSYLEVVKEELLKG